MGIRREQARDEYLTKLRRLADAGDIDRTVFNAIRAFVESLNKQLADDTNTVVILGPDAARGLEWTLGILEARDRLMEELAHRADNTRARTVFDSAAGDDAEQERVGSLTEC